MSREVSVIVPSWNRRELLARLLEGLRRQTSPPGEIVVVDNGSSDGAAEWAEQRGARVLRMGGNAGFSRAVNRGIQESRGAWLAIVNNDVEPAPDWLERLLAAAARHPEAWYLTGKILQAAARTRIDGTYDVLCRGGCAWRVGQGRSDGPEFSEGGPIWSAPATAALFRAELFRRAGLLDEHFGSYLEDVEFGLRCAVLGYGGWYAPEALAWHEGSASLGRWSPAVVRLISRNQVLLVARHYPPRLLRRCAWAVLAAQGLWGLVALRHGCGWAWLRGKGEGLRLFRGLRKQTREERLRPILADGERRIREVQARTGFDAYWRLYFLLTRGGAK